MLGEPPPGARTTNIDLPHVVHVPLRRGDCLCFMGSAQMHGAFAWQGEARRRACLFNYMARDRPGPRLRRLRPCVRSPEPKNQNF